ncbi:MAG: hypothetical protein JOZ09_04120 [Pseudonocardiales bacterium]|nr:hypothetical protein [Pseudonocardiales bacterium]
MDASVKGAMHDHDRRCDVGLFRHDAFLPVLICPFVTAAESHARRRVTPVKATGQDPGL